MKYPRVFFEILFPLCVVGLVIGLYFGIHETTSVYVPPNYNASSSTGGAGPITYLIVGAGQDNMQGYALFPSQTLDAPTGGLTQYVIGDQFSQNITSNGTIILAVEPMRDGARNDTIGPLLHIGKEYMTANGNTPVTLIQSAVLTTSSSQWITTYTNRSKNAIRAVRNLNGVVNVVMIAWLGGEQDAIAGLSEAQYLAQMQTLIQQYRNSTTGVTSSTPFVIIGMVPEWITSIGANALHISNVHRQIPNLIPYTAYRAPPMGMAGCFTGNDALSISRFSATGQRINGILYNQAYNAAKLTTSIGMVPNHPTNVAIAVSGTTTTISWTNSANATSYSLIWRSYTIWSNSICNDLLVTPPFILQVSTNPVSFVALFQPGQRYQFDVLAYNNGIPSSQPPIWQTFTA